MTDLNLSIINLNGSADDIALRALAASVVLQWRTIPDETRNSIYKLAISGKTVGIPQTTSLQQQVDSLLRRNLQAWLSKGPKGERRPADLIGNASKVMKVATGEEEEVRPAQKYKGGK